MKNIFWVMVLFLVGLIISGCDSTNQSVSNNSPANFNNVPANSQPPTEVKKWPQMTEAEKAAFVKAKSNEILAVLGHAEGDEVDENSLKKIQTNVDSYVRWIDRPKLDDCQQFSKNDLGSVLERGRKVAPDIIKSFDSNKLPVQLGLYVAMIETEFCPCLQSGTGPLGMFQLTAARGEAFGLKVVKGATPKNPDERCEVEKASLAAARYFQKTTEEGFSADSIGRVFLIFSYNMGEDQTKKLMDLVKSQTKEDKFSFWKMSSYLEKNKDKISKDDQKILELFMNESVKYVPMFMAAAIIGENPQNFGLNLEPLSKTISK